MKRSSFAKRKSVLWATVFAVILMTILSGSIAGRAEAQDAGPNAEVVNIVGCEGEQVQMLQRDVIVLNDHNVYRTSKGLPSFCVDGVLQQAATNHSNDMMTRNYFSHYSPEGETPSQRVAALRGDKCLAYNGENIAAGYSETSVTQAWIDSTGHRANIENAKSVRIGIGSAKQTSNGYTYYTTDFGYKPTCAVAPSDPAPSDPAPTDPTPADPAPADPVPTDPAPSDPAPSDPAPSDPAPSEPVPSPGFEPVNESLPPRNTAPVIRNMKPDSMNLRDRTPRITAITTDAQQRLSKSSIKVSVDGRNVSVASYSNATHKLMANSRKLTYGSHTLRIIVRDGAGEVTTKTSRFKVRR